MRVRVDGEDYYLNDTDQYARLGATEHDGCLGINLADQAGVVISAARGDENRLAVDYRMGVDDTGRVRLRIRREYSGEEFGEKNKFFSELPPEERKRYFQEAVSGVAQGARPVGDLATRFDVYPGVEEFTVDIDHYAVVDGKYLYFDLPYSLRLFPTYTDRHTLPLLIRKARIESVHAEVELPAGFRHVVIAPRSEDLVAPSGAGDVHVSAKSRRRGLVGDAGARGQARGGRPRGLLKAPLRGIRPRERVVAPPAPRALSAAAGHASG